MLLHRIECQTYYAAAGFLMPRKAVLQADKEILGYKEGLPRIPFCYQTKDSIKEMGELFGVSYSPMAYRLQEIGVLNYDFNPYI